jgi:hypothetical protein
MSYILFQVILAMTAYFQNLPVENLTCSHRLRSMILMCKHDFHAFLTCFLVYFTNLHNVIVYVS